MSIARPLLVAIAIIAAFTGCFQDEKVLKIQADGSGTIEETLVLGKIATQQMRQLLAGTGSIAQAASLDLLEEARLKEGASQWGEGVSLVSAREISTPTGHGYKATYAFTDVNQLKLNLNPGSALPPDSRLRPKSDGKKQEPVTFRFEKGSPAKLTLLVPSAKVDVKQGTPEVAPEVLAQMIQLMQDMKITFALEVPGKIIQTNAEYRDGRRLTFLALDMNKLIAAPDTLRRFLNAQPQSLSDARTLLQGVSGMKVEPATEITVQFQ